MPARQPIAAGRFYPAAPAELRKEVNHYLKNDKGIAINETEEKHVSSTIWGVMLPHAGYVFCGDIIGNTLSGLTLPNNLIILCPNHTGYGTPLSVWPDGVWNTPLGNVPVNASLAKEIIETGSGFQADYQAHLREHSIEVLLPFLQILCPNLEITPICVGTQDISVLERAARGLAQVLGEPQNSNVGVIVSSDMNHYENEAITLKKDMEALNSILTMNPQELLLVTKKERISMCGAAPMSLALLTAGLLCKMSSEVICHSTSGKVNGDHDHVVGYAGVRIFENA